MGLIRTFAVALGIVAVCVLIGRILPNSDNIQTGHDVDADYSLGVNANSENIDGVDPLEIKGYKEGTKAALYVMGAQ